MPIYVYRCECGNEIEEYFHYTNCPSTLKCDICGSDAPKGLARTSLVIKGVDSESNKLQKLLKEDRERVAKGDEDFINNIVGDPQKVPTTNAKTLSDIPENKRKIKRRKQ